jgi:hypothetical protein
VLSDVSAQSFFEIRDFLSPVRIGFTGRFFLRGVKARTDSDVRLTCVLPDQFTRPFESLVGDRPDAEKIDLMVFCPTTNVEDFDPAHTGTGRGTVVRHEVQPLTCP